MIINIASALNGPVRIKVLRVFGRNLLVKFLNFYAILFDVSGRVEYVVNANSF